MLADDESPLRGDYEMNDPETRTVFAGLDGRSDAQLPNWYAEQKPVDVYGPLEEVLRETDLDGRPLGDVMFGEIRRYRGGGEVHMDVMFDGLEVTLPDRSDPITMGVTSGYDFLGEHAVYVEGFAQDGYCSNTMRSLTDKEVVKHVGDVGNFRTWWEGILEQVELVADDLFEIYRRIVNRLRAIETEKALSTLALSIRQDLITQAPDTRPPIGADLNAAYVGAEVSWNGQYLRTVWPVQRRFPNRKF